MIQTLLPFAAVATFLALPLLQEPAPQTAGDPPIPTCTGEEITLESGLRYCVLKKGKGNQSPGMGDLVKVDYTGWLTNGKTFDSSRKAPRPGLEAKPAEFAVGGVIEGWNEALQRMVAGDHWRVYIPSAMAYGTAGSAPNIGPNEDLIFEVELHDIIQVVPRFVKWDAEAEGIKTLPSGLAYRVLTAGEGPSIQDAGQGLAGFGLFNLAGEFALAHTIVRANDGISLKPGQVPIPFMDELLSEIRLGTRLHVRVPSKLGAGSRGPVPKIPEGEDEIWILDGLRITSRPTFRLPSAEELTTTASGLQYVMLKEGEGESPTKSDRVSVDYAGWYTDGVGFDASFDRGAPSEFGVGQVISGWTEGLQLMKPGTEAIFVIPAALAYGSTPPRGIRKDADLVFYVKLHEIKGR